MAASAREARLTIKLLDRVTGPAKTISAALRGLNAVTSRFAAMSMAPARVIGGLGRNMRSSAYAASGIAAPLTIAGAAAARAVFEYEKAGNKMRAFGLLTEEQREKLEAYAQTLNKDFPFTNKDILRAAQELFRAGLTYEQAMGALRGSLNLALAGDIDIKEATDIATNVMTAMKLPMRTFDQVQDSLLRVNDALAYAATNSNTDVKLMGDTFRYVAPLAAAAGMELEQVAAVSMELAKAGIKGSEAGVALRSALVRMAKPTKPMLAAFERLGINMKDFVKYRKELDVGGVIGSLRATGFVVDDFALDLEAILKDKALQAAPARMIAELTDTIVKGIGDEAIREEVASVIADAVTAGAQEVDLFKLLATLRDKNATLTDIAQIFDVRMGSRLAAILSSDLDEATAKLKREYAGYGGKVAGYMVDGIVGSTYRVKAALENFAIRLADSGVLDAVASAFERISDAVGRLAKADPQMLKLGTYAAMALAAMAPLGLALSGVAATVGLLVNPLTWVAGSLAALAYLKWDGLKAGVKGFGEGFRSALNEDTLSALDRVTAKYNEWFGLAKEAPDTSAWASWGKRIGTIAGEAANWIVDLPAKLEALPGQMFAIGQQAIQSLWDGLKSKVEQLLAWVQGVASRLASAFSFTASPSIAPRMSSREAESGSMTALKRAVGRGDIDGARASGGPVQAGLTYRVNEKGIETITLGRNGYVTPAHKAGGGNQITNHFTISGVTDPIAVARQVSRELDRLFGRSNALAMDGREIG